MAGTATEYIQHHLTHLSTVKQTSIVDFSVFNFDTAVFSIAMMILALWVLYSAARKATTGVPGKWQCAVEMLVEMVSVSQSVLTVKCLGWPGSSPSVAGPLFCLISFTPTSSVLNSPCHSKSVCISGCLTSSVTLYFALKTPG